MSVLSVTEYAAAQGGGKQGIFIIACHVYKW